MRQMFSLCLTFLVAATPWQNGSQASAPWVSRERENARQIFFKSLNDGLSAITPSSNSKGNSSKTSSKRSASKAATAIASSTVPSTSTTTSTPGTASGADSSTVIAPTTVTVEERADLKEIPWASHRTLYPRIKKQASWLWPVENARIISGFGLRRGRVHEGLDLRAAYGTPVRSTLPGRVVFSGTMSGYGKTVVVYHGDGWSSLYAHLSELSLRRGASVDRGDIVGSAGQSGRTSGPHLHFEVRRDGSPVNPVSLSFSEWPYMASHKAK